MSDGPTPPLGDEFTASPPPLTSAGRAKRAGAHFAPKSNKGPGRFSRKGSKSTAPAQGGGRRRWPRRTAIGAVIVVVLVALVAVSGWVYANIRYNQIKKVVIPGLTHRPSAPGAPFNILLVGSDSRQFVDNSSEANSFGSGSTVTGQRSDVIIVARVVPATHQILMLSIPRDTWVKIPGNVPDVSGYNRVNAAFNSGPALLVETLKQDFGIPVSHYVEVNFEGFSNIVNAIGGIYLKFTVPVKDKETGLNITRPGCQLINGTQALALVRSRDLSYESSPGNWQYDGMGDWSRIRRQDAFFRATISRADSQLSNPLALNSFIGAIVHDITIDTTLGETELFDLATEFHGLGQNALQTEVLPTTPQVLNGNDVLLEAQPYDQQMITKFLAFGTGTKSSGSGSGHSGSSSTTSTAPSITPSQVTVSVLNGNGRANAAGNAASQLRGIGYTVSSTGDASTFTYSSNEIEYGSSGQAAANLLKASLVGGATLVPDSSLQGNDVTLIVGSSYTGVVAPAGGSTSPTTTTTPASSTPASDVVFDNPQTLPEPWNPTPCNP